MKHTVNGGMHQVCTNLIIGPNFHEGENGVLGVSMGKSRIAQIVRHGIPYLANIRIGPLKMRPTL